MNETREQTVARLLKEERQERLIGNFEFSVRTSNVLNNMNLNTVKKIRQAIVDSSLHPKSKLPRRRNFGRKSYIEVCEKLGIDYTCTQKKTCPHRCPHCGKEL